MYSDSDTNIWHFPSVSGWQICRGHPLTFWPCRALWVMMILMAWQPTYPPAIWSSCHGRWLRRRPTTGQPLIFFFNREQPRPHPLLPLTVSLYSDPLASCSPWTLTSERVELEVTVNAPAAHLHHQHPTHLVVHYCCILTQSPYYNLTNALLLICARPTIIKEATAWKKSGYVHWKI